MIQSIPDFDFKKIQAKNTHHFNCIRGFDSNCKYGQKSYDNPKALHNIEFPIATQTLKFLYHKIYFFINLSNNISY